MSAGFDRRLARIEGTVTGNGAVVAMSDDALQARLLELTRRAAVTPDLEPELRDRAAQAEADLIAGIRRQAHLLRDGFYSDRPAAYVPPVFDGIGGCPDFHTARPGVMALRKTLRSRPMIAMITQEGTV